MTPIAVLGTGTMGLPMARNLLRAGFEVRAWNRSSERARPLAEEGARLCEDPAEAVAGSEIALTMLSDGDAVLETARAMGGALGDGCRWLQMSTIGIEATRRCAELAEELGVGFVDAPVLGTREPAEKGQLIVLASGEAGDVEACAPVFAAVGQRTVELGAAGAGTRAKIVANSWVVGLVALLSETLNLAEGLDVPAQAFFEAIEGGPLDLPYARVKGAAMLERSFEEVSFRLGLARKDADLVLHAAAGANLATPVLAAVAERMRRAEDAGHGGKDLAAVFLAGRE